MHADASFSTGQSGRQTTLIECGPPAFGVYISWLRLEAETLGDHISALAHAKSLQSKAEGPLSGSEDMTVEGVTLADYCEGRGVVEDGGNR